MALLFAYGISFLENDGEEAKIGYQEIFLCKSDHYKLEPTACRTVRDFNL
jgi:hypothetical protein